MHLSGYMSGKIMQGNVWAVKRFLFLHRHSHEAINARTPVKKRFLLHFGGDTALTLAVKNRKDEIVKLLVASARVDVNKTDAQGFTPLMLAAQYQSREIFNLLLKRKDIQLEIETPWHGNTALFSAYKFGTQEMVDTLLKCGANPDHKNHRGMTAKQNANRAEYAMNEPVDFAFT